MTTSTYLLALLRTTFYLYPYNLYPYRFFFFNDTPTTEIYTLSLHDALPICLAAERKLPQFREEVRRLELEAADFLAELRSEEHTSELQSQSNLVCRLLLEKKKKKIIKPIKLYRILDVNRPLSLDINRLHSTN